MLKSIEGKYVAGRDSKSALAVVKRLNKKKISASLDILLAKPKSNEEAMHNAESYIKLISAIARAKAGANISLKLTQIGLALGEALCEKNLFEIADTAAAKNNSLTIDMEEHKYKDATIKIFEKLLQQNKNVMLTVQAYLHSSYHDAKMLLAKGASLRLVKGAYTESRGVAFTSDEDIDKNYIEIARLLLRSDGFHAFATHDEKLMDFVKYAAKTKQLPQRSFEFQTLYGVSTELPVGLAEEGYAVRVYVPYGKEWLPYVMRRIREAWR